jgi:hypothetical protein
MDLGRQYILENLKRITASVTDCLLINWITNSLFDGYMLNSSKEIPMEK